MKKVGIISLKNVVADLLEKQLKYFLNGRVEFTRYILESDKEIECDADLLLLTVGALAKNVKLPSNKPIPVLSPRRTLTIQGWEILRSLPEGTSALLVNDTQESVEEFMTLIKEFGLNLDLHGYYPGCRNYPKLETAITPGEIRYTPPFVKRVVDVGNRIFDPSVILELLSRLELFEWEDLGKILLYSKTVKSTQSGFQKFLLDMATVSLEFRTVLSMARQAVVSYSENDGKVMLFNSFAEKYFGMRSSETVGNSAKVILEKLGLERIAHDLNNEIVELDGAEMVLNAKKVTMGIVMLSIYPVEVHSEIEKKHVVKVRKSGLTAKATFPTIIGGRKLRESMKLAKKMSLSEIPILIEGESGTGKELLAQAIHNYSKRSGGPFVPINCASLSEELLESELFGYEEGAFTGAKKGGKPGLFEIANNGTIFLDEISEIPFSLQSKMLRVLQEKEIIKIGGVQIIPVNVRIISATNRDLFRMVEEENFRRDLFYRISTFQLRLPPLRERIEDLDLLTKHIAKKKNYSVRISDSLMEVLKNYSWPGNIREVENFVDYVGNLFSGEIGMHELPPYLSRRLISNSKALSDEELRIMNFIMKNERSGREKIARSCALSQNRVRTILDRLRKNGYVTVNRGRKGVELTEIGIQLNALLNNDI